MVYGSDTMDRRMFIFSVISFFAGLWSSKLFFNKNFKFNFLYNPANLKEAKFYKKL